MEDQKHPDHVYTRYNIWMKNPLFWMENGTLLQQNHSFSRKMVPCCNKTIVFRVKLYLVATKPWFFEENCTLLQQNNEFSGATKPDKPCPWFGSWTPKNIKNTSVPLKRECCEGCWAHVIRVLIEFELILCNFALLLDAKNTKDGFNREGCWAHFIWVLIAFELILSNFAWIWTSETQGWRPAQLHWAQP